MKPTEISLERRPRGTSGRCVDGEEGGARCKRRASECLTWTNVYPDPMGGIKPPVRVENHRELCEPHALEWFSKLKTWNRLKGGD